MKLKVIEMLIPKSNTFTRPQIKRKPKSITIHETANTRVRANALAHAKLQFNGNRRQASWNYTVDDEPEVYLSIPEDEMTYHAGNSKGNKESISIEMCVNKDGNYKQTVKNTIQLVRYLIEKYPTITHVDVVQHYFWSNKDCPHFLRSGVKGINWEQFIEGVKGGKAEVTKPSKPPKHQQTSGQFKIGQKVTLKNTAKRYATGEKIPSKYKGKTYTVMQRGSNRVLLKELYSWVHTKDLIGGKGSSNEGKKQPTPNIKVGNKVRIKNTAKKYATGENIPSRYKNKPYTIQQIKNDRVLLKELYSWVYKTDLVGYKSNGKSSESSSTTNIKSGSKVTIKGTAKRYATGEKIPSKYKGKTYTVQQVKSDRVLIKELYSWVYKKDLVGNKASKPKKTNYRVGSKVKLKKSAKKYATGESIPARYKGKTYTIQQIKKDRVLIKELYSWVNKSDII